jgi:WD40 repeat protein/tetratricopeptide (TPR) repeat protein
MVLLALGAIQYFRDIPPRQEQMARELERSRRGQYALQLMVVANLWQRDPGHALELLEDCERYPEDLRDFTWHYLHRLCRRERLAIRLPTLHPGTALVFSPDGKSFASAHVGRWGGVVKVWDAATGKERNTLTVGAEAPCSLAFSPEGSLLASGDIKGTIKLWETATGKERSSWTGHPGSVNSLAFARDGQVLASAGGVKWGPEEKGLIEHFAELKLWEVATLKERVAFEGLQGEVHAVAFSPDGQVLASASGTSNLLENTDCAVRLWDWHQARPRARAILRHPFAVSSLAFAPDGKVLATASSRTLRLWDVGPEVRAFDKERAAWTQPEWDIAALALAPDGRSLATMTRAGLRVHLWDTSGGERTVFRMLSTSNSGYGAWAISFSPDSHSLACLGEGIRVWDLTPTTGHATLGGPGDIGPKLEHFGSVVAFPPDSSSLVCAINDGTTPTLSLWDGKTKQAQQRTTIGPSRRGTKVRSIRCLTIAPDGGTLAVAGDDTEGRRIASLWDLDGFRKRAELAVGEGAEECTPAARSLAFSPDGALLAVACDDHAIELWNTASGDKEATIQAYRPRKDIAARGLLFRDPEGVVRSVAFSPHGKFLAAGVWEPHGGHVGASFVKLFDVTTHQELAKLPCSDKAEGLWAMSPTPMAFSPDGKFLAAASHAYQTKDFGRVTLWDIATKQAQAIFRTRTVIYSMAFSPDGSTLAVATGGGLSKGGAVQLWDAVTGQVRASFAGEAATSVAFSDDGHLLAAADIAGDIHLWNGTPGPDTEGEPRPLLRSGGLPFGTAPGRRPVWADEPVTDFGMWLLMLLPVWYLSTFCHELGHAVLARCVGFTVCSFGMGLGRPFLVRSWGGLRVFLCLHRPLQGISFAVSAERPIGRGGRALMLAGGVLANALLAVIALQVRSLVPWGSNLWTMVFLFNGIMAIGNLIPFSSRVGPFQVLTDGAQVLMTLRGRMALAPAPGRIARFRSLRPLFQDIGDPINLHAAVIDAASAWLELGDVEEADCLCQQAEALAQSNCPLLVANEKLLRGAIARRRGDFATAASALDGAEATFREQSHPYGALVAGLGRVELLVEQRELSQALATLQELETVLPGTDQRLSQLSLLVLRLRILTASADVAGVEALRSEYEAARATLPSVARDRAIHLAIGKMYATLGNWERADRDLSQAIAAATSLHALLPDAEDQARFARAQEDLVTAARQCREHLGKDAEDLLSPFPTGDEWTRRQAMAQQGSGRARRRWAVALLLFNMVASIGLVGLMVLIDSQASRPAWVELVLGVRAPLAPTSTTGQYLARLSVIAEARLGHSGGSLLFALVPFTALTLVYIAVASALYRLRPSWGRFGYPGALFLGVIPWVVFGISLLPHTWLQPDVP